jgi:translation elongation factor EF-G
MGRWIPLADAVLRMVVRWIPNPREAQHQKLQYFFSAASHERIDEGHFPSLWLFVCSLTFMTT